MSQDQPLEDTLHGPQHLQQHGVVLPTLSFDAFGTRSPFLANSASFPPTQNLPNHLPLSCSPYSNPGYPFQIPTNNMSSPTMEMADVYCRTITNSLHPRVEFKSPREYHPPPLHRPLWPNYAPGYSLPVGQMHSRLPSTDVSRKAPRKSIASSPRNSLLQLSSSDNKPTQTKTSKDGHRKKRKDSIAPQQQEAAKNDTHKRRKVAPPAQKSTPTKGHQLPLSASIRRPIILDDEDEEDGDEEDKSDKDPSSGAYNAPGTAKTPAAVAKPAMTTRRRFAAAQRIPPPRPRYVYIVPKKLEGIKKALGEDDLNEYLILTERKLLGEITEEKFEAQSKRIFLVLDERTGGKIEELVVNMVAPVIKQHAEERAGQHGLDQV